MKKLLSSIIALTLASCAPALADPPVSPVNAVIKVSECTTETEDALIEFAKGLESSQVTILKGPAALNFREVLAEINGVPVTGIHEADTILFAHPKNGEVGVIVFFVNGCRTQMFNVPVSDTYKIIERSKGF